KELGTLLGLQQLSCADRVQYHCKWEILQTFGEFVKMNRLLNENNTTEINLNSDLRNLFCNDSSSSSTTVLKNHLYLGDLWNTLIDFKHVMLPDPILIQHKILFVLFFYYLFYLINVVWNIENNTRIYDVVVKLPTDDFKKILEMSDQWNDCVAEMDEQISNTLEQIKDCVKQQQWFESFEKDPINTIDVTIQNQKENLQTIQEFCEGAKMKPSHFFQRPDVLEKAIPEYLESLSNQSIQEKTKYKDSKPKENETKHTQKP
ncbi:hypothetical protein RFI_11522, partial [Reticulomyxa filosa]